MNQNIFQIQQRILTQIISCSLDYQNDDLVSLLKKSLDTIVDLPWLPVHKKGAIFLTGEDNTSLDLVCHHNLHPALQSICRKVPFGHCICGRAAVSKEIIFKPCVDEHHENSFDEMQPHGHYAVPLLSSKNDILGMLILYVDHDHKQTDEETSFLDSVGRAISFLIERVHKNIEISKLEERITLNNIAVSVAHEINNPLAIALGFLGHLEKKQGPSNELKKIDESLQRIAGLVRRISSLSISDAKKVPYTETSSMFSLDQSLEFRHQLLMALESSCSICITDRNDKMVFLNQKFCHSHGYTKDELMGNNISLLQSEVHESDFYKSIRESINAGVTWTGDLSNKNKDGSISSFSTQIIPTENYFIYLKWRSAPLAPV